MPKQFNKATILFGAGAVLDWHAPSTLELTELVLNTGFYISDNKTRITQFIYDTLVKENGYSATLVNFETIINVIEELIVYYSYFDARARTKSLNQLFFISRFDDQLLNFTVANSGVSNRFKLEIPKGITNEYASIPSQNVTPEQHFFQSLLKELLSAIQFEISGYAYHTKSHSLVIREENLANNLLFTDWANKITGNGCLRMYTLNYDRLFKVILENSSSHYEIFEGFDCDNQIDYIAHIPANIPKIISDTNSHVMYNLHGSSFWRLNDRDMFPSENPQFYLTTNINAETNQTSVTYQSEMGKTMLLTNIITGYQKTQKSILSPYKQMQAAFDRDCCFSDTVYIIGYSFNDEHINAGIKASIQANQPVNFVIVDPGFKKDNFDEKVFIRIFSNARAVGQSKNLTKDIHSFYDGKFIVYAMTFTDFMNFKLAQRYDGDFYSRQ
jgi:hypothetical protein